MDGYHELRTIMHTIGLHDVVTVTKNDSNAVNVTCSVPLPADNTAYRAAKLFYEKTGSGGVDIHIEKGIPSEAGMGGASADAAAVLRGMKQLFGKIDEKALFDIGKAVGADVPFCLLGGCALAEGIGERLTKLRQQRLNLLVIKGSRGVSTGKLFTSLNLPPLNNEEATAFIGGNTQKRNSLRLAAAIESKLDTDACMIAASINNELMPPATLFVPEIAEYRQRLLDLGAVGACMTGSGSAVYGIFKTREEAIAASKHFPDCEFVMPCTTV